MEWALSLPVCFLPFCTCRSIESILTIATDDYINTATNQKSKPLNIVIKIASANGRPAVKLSDNMGKNTGDKSTVLEVKKTLGYVEQEWEAGDEANRWSK